ncbi:cytochrome P450 [Phascolomyces articulosus]|uniref:Cytochrome P450 n=1 Tax=Phascolomyces articulosus TaxID=60185 RepID=A0AAD5K175_9FUNG|nr:cytochrome P450 [Phascolomyces articulosus]
MACISYFGKLYTKNMSNTTFLMDYFPEDSPIMQFSGRDNVAIINGEHWKSQRKIMNPAFHRSMPVGVFGSLMPSVFELIEQTQNSGEGYISASKLTRRLTLDALGKAAFDFDFFALKDENSVWVTTYNQVLESFLEVIPTFVPAVDYVYRFFSRQRRERYNATFKLISLLDDLADKKRVELQQKPDLDNKAQNEKDLLTLMLEAEIRGEGSWTKEELRHNMAIFFLAGHDTTSNSLAFCLYYLAINQDVQTKAREEVLSVLGNDMEDVFPTLEDCKKFPYLDMCIKEGLRLQPPANEITPRLTPKDTDLDLGGIVIPRGSMVNVDIQALHYNPNLWHEPEKFIPERFAENGEHSLHEGVTYAPFSSGGRVCLGINFSMAEQRVVLSMLLKKYEWKLPSNSIHREGIVMGQTFNLAPESLTIQFNNRY